MFDKCLQDFKNIDFKEINNHKTFRGIILALFILEIFFSVYVLSTYKVYALEIFKYIYFVVFFIILQGLFFCRITGLKLEKLEKLLVAYSLGMILCVLEYYIVKRFFFKDIMFFCVNFFAIIEVYLRFVHSLKYNDFSKENIKELINKNFNIGIVFICSSVVFVNLFAFSMKNPMPDLGGTISYDTRVLEDVSHAQSYIRGIPTIDSEVYGVKIKRQSFKAIYIAAASSMTGISTVKVGFYLSNLNNMFFMVLAAYLMLKRILKGRKGATIGTLIIFLFNGIYGILHTDKGFIIEGTFKDLIFTSSGNEITCMYLFLISYFIIKSLQEVKLGKKQEIIISLLFVALTFSNIYIAIIVIIALFLMPHKHIKDNYFKRDFRAMRWIMLSIVVAVSILFLSDESLALGFKLVDENQKGVLASFLLSIKSKVAPIGFGIIGGILSMLLDVFYGVVKFILIAPPISVIYIFMIKKGYRDISSLSNTYMARISLILIMATYIFGFKFSSDSTLVVISMIFMIIFVMKGLEEFQCYDNYIKYVTCGFMIIPILTTTLGLFNGVIGGGSAFYNVSNGSLVNQSFMYDSITKGEYEALQWINLNSSNEDVIATDIHYTSSEFSDKVAEHKYYSVFSERQMYVEGYKDALSSNNKLKKVLENKAINERIYNNDNTVINEIIGKNIRFIMVSKQIHPDLVIKWERVERVFENNDTTVYEIK